MIRARFYVNLVDPRPVVWPIKHPYWVTGCSETHSIIVAYSDDEEEILRNWPDAENIEAEECEEYVFTGRFPKPKWFIEAADSGKDGV